MRDNRYANMWNETPEEQEKRRQYLYDVYDASVRRNEEQTPYQKSFNGQFEKLTDLEKNSGNYYKQSTHQPVSANISTIKICF